MRATIEDSFDFAVTDIKFVVRREPDEKWRLVRRSYANYYILVIALLGQADYSDGKHSFPVKQGDVVLFQKGETHSAQSTSQSPWSFISVAFDILPFGNKIELDQIPTINKPLFFSDYAKLFQELHKQWELKEKGATLKCRSLIGDLLYLLIKDSRTNVAPSNTHENIIRIKNYLAENCNKNFKIEELARLSSLSPSHFRMLFKKYTGETAIQFHNRIKILKACDLLKSGVCNVTEVAYAVGFNDIYYFSRLFKKIMGCSPSKYLDEHNKIHS